MTVLTLNDTSFVVHWHDIWSSNADPVHEVAGRPRR